MEKQGIKQTLEALEALAVLAKAVKEVAKDGKVNISDLSVLMSLLNNMSVFVAGIQGADKIDDEIKDLDGDEAKELVGRVVAIVASIKAA